MSASLRSLPLYLLLSLATAPVAWAAPPTDVDDDADQDEEALAVDADGNYDPAAELQRQLARSAAKAANAGSGGPPQACVISGKVTLFGVTHDIRDCMASTGRYSVAEFKKHCEGLANAFNGTGNAPAKLEYLPACPRPAQGSCRNVLGSGLDGYYYQRTADDLAQLPASCAAGGGRWQPVR